VADKVDLLADKADLLADKADPLADKADPLADKDDHLADKVDHLADKADHLVVVRGAARGVDQTPELTRRTLRRPGPVTARHSDRRLDLHSADPEERKPSSSSAPWSPG